MSRKIISSPVLIIVALVLGASCNRGKNASPKGPIPVSSQTQSGVKEFDYTLLRGKSGFSESEEGWIFKKALSFQNETNEQFMITLEARGSKVVTGVSGMPLVTLFCDYLDEKGNYRFGEVTEAAFNFDHQKPSEGYLFLFENGSFGSTPIYSKQLFIDFLTDLSNHDSLSVAIGYGPLMSQQDLSGAIYDDTLKDFAKVVIDSGMVDCIDFSEYSLIFKELCKIYKPQWK